jgi:hypothetical protein
MHRLGNKPRDYVRTWVRDNLQANAHRQNRDYYAMMHRGDWLYRKAQLKEMGKTISLAKSNNDADVALDCMNDYALSWARRLLDLSSVMNDLFDDYTFKECADCNRIEYEDDMSWAYDDYIICSRCRDHNYHWSDYRDTYVRDDDDNADDRGIIGEYHSSSECFDGIPSATDNKIRLGIELEVEVQDDYDREDKAEHLLNAIGSHYSKVAGSSITYALCEHDGSLDHGFEIVSNYADLATHAEQLKFFKNRWQGVRSHDTSTCGLHIHIDKADMTLYHASKLVLFINSPDNDKMVHALARRNSDSYGKRYDKSNDLSWLKDAKRHERKRNQLCSLNNDRYEALNFQNTNTIEFRLFKGTLKYMTIMACLEFTYASWYFTRQASASDLTTDNFLAFISEPANKGNSVNLRAYLISKGFKLPASGEIKANPRIDAPATQLEV